MELRDDIFRINNLHVTVEGKKILKGINIKIRSGEIHALMGPNGSGKSTLAMTLMGHPKYKIEGGEILFKSEDISLLKTDERARKGLFLAFQYPISIPGITVANFLRSAYRSLNKGKSGSFNLMEFRKLLKEKMDLLKIESSFASRYLNDGFSGGEVKKLEILQMEMLEPDMAILDETDSGLDIDALRIVSEGVNRLLKKELGILIITHYQRILSYIKPEFVHIMIDGEIVLSGGPDLVGVLEKKGYDWLRQKKGSSEPLGVITDDDKRV